MSITPEATLATAQTEGEAPLARPFPQLFDIVYALLLLGACTPDQREDVRRGRIPVSKGRILSAVIRAEEEGRQGLRLKELATEAGLPLSTVSETVDQFVKAGVMTRTRLETDRRSVLIRATDKGHTTIKNSNLDEIWQRAVVGVSQEDLEAFWRVVKVASQALKNFPTEPVADESVTPQASSKKPQ